MKYLARVAQTHFTEVEIEANSKEEADTILHGMNERGGFSFTDIDTTWDIETLDREEDTEYTSKKEVTVNGATHPYTLDIWYSDENGGYMFDLYEGHVSPEDLDPSNSFDGGCCTGSHDEAVEMAETQATMHFTK